MLSIVWAPGDVAASQPYGWTDLAVEPLWQGRHFHTGIDIPLDIGTPLYAPRGGTVVYVGWGLLAIQATDTQTDWYVHIDSSHVPLGAPIDRGNLVAYSGAKVPAGGSLTGPHLHFEIQDAALNDAANGIFAHLNFPPTSVDPVSVLTGVLEADMTPQQEETLNAIYAILSGSRLKGKATDQALHDIEAKVVTGGGAEPVEPAEPAEPKTLTLTVTLPAQTVTGTGTLS